MKALRISYREKGAEHQDRITKEAEPSSSPFPEKLMLLLKHLQKERERDIANKRIKFTPFTMKTLPKEVGGSWSTPRPPRIHKCLLWEGFNPLQPSALGRMSPPP